MHYRKVKRILSAKNGMNLYRGCSHGCIYCDFRSRCYHIEHAFEDIGVKENALELLETALRRKRKKCMIGTGAMTDPYIPLETELCQTRRALELIEVCLTPILPFINDTRENISGILDLCIEAQVYGIICFGMGITLREGSREYFHQ